MASTPEGRVKAAVKKFLNSLAECWWFCPVSNGMGMMGIPDFIVCWQGVFIGIETKAPGKLSGVTPLQQRQLSGINAASGYAIVIDDAAHLPKLFNELAAVKGLPPCA